MSKNKQTEPLQYCGTCHRYGDGSGWVMLPVWAGMSVPMALARDEPVTCPACRNIYREQFQPLVDAFSELTGLASRGRPHAEVSAACVRLRVALDALEKVARIRPRNLDTALRIWWCGLEPIMEDGGPVRRILTEPGLVGLADLVREICAEMPEMVPVSYDQLKKELKFSLHALIKYGEHEKDCSFDGEITPCSCGYSDGIKRVQSVNRELK